MRHASTIGALGVILLACGESSGGAEPATPPLSYLSLFPDRRVAVVGELITLKVTARDLAGADVPNVVPSYTSSNSTVVRIEPSGAFAAGVGTATVRASAGGLTAVSGPPSVTAIPTARRPAGA